MSLFLAVDAGGTKTDYLLADETHEIARVRGGTIKRMRANAETTAANLDHALTELAATSGISMQSVTGTCIGTAGETVPLVVDWLRQSFATRVSGQQLILGDIEIALDAAFPGQPRSCRDRGTGSNVAARDTQGQVTRAGGYGPVLADQGSGHRIGHEALRALFMAIDEEQRPACCLPCSSSGTSLPPTTSSPTRTRYPRQTSPASPRSSSTRPDQGDTVAASVLEREGRDLAHLVNLLIARIRKTSVDPTLIPSLAFTGSIVEKILPVRNALINAVQQSFPGVVALAGVVDPIAGALYRARRGH